MLLGQKSRFELGPCRDWIFYWEVNERIKERNSRMTFLLCVVLLFFFDQTDGIFSAFSLTRLRPANVLFFFAWSRSRRPAAHTRHRRNSRNSTLRKTLSQAHTRRACDRRFIGPESVLHKDWTQAAQES